MLAYLKAKLDFVAAISVLLIGVMVVAAGYIGGSQATTEMGFAVFAAGLIYILIRKNLADSSVPDIKLSTSLSLAFNVIFIVAMTWSFWLLNGYAQRPPLYFWLITVSVATLTLDILGSKNNTGTWWLLIKILVITANLRIGLYYEQPGFIGNDAWLHGALIDTWTEIGHISPFVSRLIQGYNSYAYYPLMHLEVMAMQMVTGLNLKDALFSSIGISNIGIPLFVFLIVSQIMDRRSGLLAALFISIAVPTIAFGVVPIATSFGLAIFAIILFIVLRTSSNNAIRSLLLIASIVLILSHTIAAFITSLTLLLLFIGSETHQKLGGSRGRQLNLSLIFILLFFVIALTQWLYSDMSEGVSFLASIIKLYIFVFTNKMEFVGTVVHIASNSILNRGWFLVFIILTALGVLSWLRPDKFRKQEVSIIAAALGLSVITFVLPLLNIENLIPGRWPPFIFVVSAAIVVQGILALATIMKTGVFPVMIVVLIMSTFSFLSINTGQINMLTPFLSEETRISFIRSELGAANTVKKMYHGTITTDWDYSELVFRTQSKSNALTWLDPEIKPEGLILLREHIRKNPQLVEYHWREGKPTLEETANFYSKFVSVEHSLVYNNGEVLGYQKNVKK